MVTVDEFSRLVARIYAAAVTPELWEAAVRDIHRTVGGAHGALLVNDGVSRSIIVATAPAEAGKSYAEYYHRLDYVLAAVEKGPVGAVRTGSELTDPPKHREFHADWARPWEGDDGLVIRLTDGPRPTCFVVGALRRSEWFDTPERIKLVGGLVIHLQQALRTQNKFGALTDSTADLIGALDTVRNCVIVVSSAQKVVHLNSAAENTLLAEDGLHVRSGHVGATSPPTQRELDRALHLALRGGRSGIRSGHSFTVPRPSGKRPYVIHVVPLQPAATIGRSCDTAALVVITDPERETEPTTELLRHLYGLTNGEADVAVRLAAGVGLKQISDELSVSYQTVRTHLQHVFDKTDTHRQAELVHLLLSLEPPVR
jgi:DNA-binding CsgD family transcriptional regulator